MSSWKAQASRAAPRAAALIWAAYDATRAAATITRGAINWCVCHTS
jgi:hypothetical protein